MIFERKIYSKLLSWKNECNGSKTWLIIGFLAGSFVLEFGMNAVV